MLAIMYILSMAVAVTWKFNGEEVYYFYRYFIATFWTLLWMFDVFVKKKHFKRQDIVYLQLLAIPQIAILLWTLIAWCLNPPMILDLSYFSRVCSNVVTMLLTVTCAVAAGHFFRREVIKYTLYAIVLSTLVNLLVVLPQFGIGTLMQFVSSAWIVTNLDYYSMVTRLSLMLEVHDATFACGIFIIYYLFFYEKTNKNRWYYIMLAFICFYLGYKRGVLVGIFTVFIVLPFLKYKEESFGEIVKLIAIIITVVGFSYIIGIRYHLIERIANFLELDFSGRFGIYDMLAEYYVLSPFFVGTGYGYMNKYLFEYMGYASHSDIVRMYVEIGFIPYILWLHHNLVRIPNKVYKEFGAETGQVMLALTLYMFTTYVSDNTMTLFATQFSFCILPIGLSYPKEQIKKRFKIVMR